MGNYKFRYCDQCAKAHNLEVMAVKPVKGECEICHKRIERLNEADVEKNDYTQINAGSFRVVQLDNFVPGLPAKSVHPTLHYRTMAPDMAIYFPTLEDGDGKKSLIIANPLKGEQIQIFWDEYEFTSKVIGTIVNEELVPAEEAV